MLLLRWWISTPWTIFRPSDVGTVTAMPVPVIPGSMPSLASAMTELPASVSIRRMAKRPCFHVFIALPWLVSLLARDGLVGERGVPLLSSTGMVAWLVGADCLVMGVLGWAVSPYSFYGSWDRQLGAVPLPFRRLAHAPEGILHLGADTALWLESCWLAKHLQVVMVCHSVGVAGSVSSPFIRLGLCSALLMSWSGLLRRLMLILGAKPERRSSVARLCGLRIVRLWCRLIPV